MRGLEARASKEPGRWLPLWLLVSLVWLTGCSGQPISSDETPTPSPTATAASTWTPRPTFTETITPAAAPTVEPLPSDPLVIEFEAEDGTKLTGTYFPAATNPAPLIIMMHWAQGDQSDWRSIALWLQNRSAFEPDYPLPEAPEGSSYAVFTFNFRGFGLGAGPSITIWDPDGWAKDLRAALKIARGLPGVNAERYLTIGASIGADAAVLVCQDGCRGALSLSPGGFLNVPYAEAVDQARTQSKQAVFWCLASEGDQTSAQACESASGEDYHKQIYTGDAHGMDLFDGDQEPSIGQLFLDFINAGFGED